ncbi:RNA polymerase sigma factor [bacterium]|nr:RNA polymerase sigma factor [bacterium]
MATRDQIFQSWIERHKGLLLKVIRSYESTLDGQDDLFQEILVQLWNSIPHFRNESRETTWIYRVALNTALVWVRTQKRSRAKHRRILESAIEQQRANPCAATVAANSDDAVESLYRAIRRLPVIDASLILMHLDGVSYDEMADVLGITKSHAGVRLSRAKQKLAELMKGVSDEF